MTSPPMVRRARELRREMTPSERLLWGMLRRRQTGLRFRHEHPVGPYVMDFYCASARLGIEVDGPVHDEPGQIEHDRIRDEWLRAHRILVLRFSVAEVEQTPAAVIARIVQAAPPPSPNRRHLPRAKRRGGSD